MNAQTAMENAYSSGMGYSFLLQWFGFRFGYEVVSIDNISSQAGSDAFLFWELSVNGVTANRGVDQTRLNDGDQIGWNYRAFNPKLEGGGRYASIKEQAKGRS
jgi:hypothetical protein